MVQNVMCRWWQGTHYSPSEIRMLKIWRRRKSLGCGAAYQLLPQSPTSKIHGLSWKPLSHAPQGVRRSSTTSPRVWTRCHWGGLLAIGIVHFTVTPLVTEGRHTHTLRSFRDLYLPLYKCLKTVLSFVIFHPFVLQKLKMWKQIFLNKTWNWVSKISLLAMPIVINPYLMFYLPRMRFWQSQLHLQPFDNSFILNAPLTKHSNFPQ